VIYLITTASLGHLNIIVSLSYNSVLRPFQWSGTLCSNFDCSWNPCLFGVTP